MINISRLLAGFLLLGNFYSCKEVQAESSESPNSVEHISVEEMKLHLQMEDVQLIDIRSRDDYTDAHIVNAENIVFDKEFRKKLTKLDKIRPVLLYCTDGSKSKEALKILKRMGFQNVQELDEGFKQWVAKNGQVKTPE
ncbi:rhodanese-like domain-containing protein [Salegentibacter sediminis]|uniref:rhodanese-like domain-containing protein n=1 Tax=Salegentibacter sediminis TaxID=1930251 RepID=UPI0009BCCF8E|nr:rhodanese-like domain-containing protein [Salegentibacter sediminis]